MKCENCKKQVKEGAKFCNSCGTPTVNSANYSSPPSDVTTDTSKNKKGLMKKLGIAIVVLVMVVIGVINRLDESALYKNEDALDSFNSGDSQTAISQLEKATGQAINDENKANMLINLTYIYLSENRIQEATEALLEAQSIAKPNGFEYYLISGEIELIEFDFSSALTNFKKAYDLKPNDFQINNSLALFYLDMDETAPEYEDFPRALFHAKLSYANDPEKLVSSKETLAVANYFNNNFSEAIDMLETINLSEHPYLSYWLGLCYLSIDDPDTAITHFQSAKDAGIELPDEIIEYLD
jgi:tetratricopeptide (TPR) repeat protein